MECRRAAVDAVGDLRHRVTATWNTSNDPNAMAGAADFAARSEHACSENDLLPNAERARWSERRASGTEADSGGCNDCGYQVPALHRDLSPSPSTLRRQLSSPTSGSDGATRRRARPLGLRSPFQCESADAWSVTAGRAPRARGVRARPRAQATDVTHDRVRAGQAARPDRVRRSRASER